MNKKTRNSNVGKLTGHEQVLEFLQKLEHPLKLQIEEVRRIILDSNDQISEHIKWNAPSFCMNKQDRITFNLHGNEGFRLVFHCGSKKTEYEDKGPLFLDETKQLDWITGDRATLRFLSESDVENKREILKQIVTKWIEVTKDI